MNKKFIAILIVLMGISIVGIIAVQLVWMNNATQVKNELFNRSVNEALNNTVNKMEDIHDFGVVNQMVFDDSLQWLNEFDIDFNFATPPASRPPLPPQPEPDSFPEPPAHVQIVSPPTPRIINLDSLRNGFTNQYSYSVTTNSENDSELVVIDGDNERNEIIIFRNDSIFTKLDSIVNVSTIRIDSVLARLDSMTATTPQLTERINQRAGDLKRVASQVVTEIAFWDADEIDTVQLKNILTEELRNRDVPIDFQFGIFSDDILYAHSEAADSSGLANSEYNVELYPNSIFERNLKLSVLFPERDSFIHRSLNWLLIASLLFSLFIFSAFSLSIYYILRQKKISEMKSDFINNMTHEFKTPIATISVATDSIANDKVLHDPERIKYFTGMIKKENARMNQQVEDILTIARLDRKDFEFNWEPIDVHELIQDAIEGIKLQVTKRKGNIATGFEAKNSVITTDKNHCTNLVFNLLDNAIKYSDGPPEITVSTENRNNGVLISVADKGIGMSKNVQAKIFEKFYRQSSGNIHNVKGFGLGLSYVKAVVEANRGTISVKSEPGKGSRFDVFLPFVRD